MREAMQSLSSQRIALDSDDFIDDAIHADKRQQSAAAGKDVLMLSAGWGQASSCLLPAGKALQILCNLQIECLRLQTHVPHMQSAPLLDSTKLECCTAAQL